MRIESKLYKEVIKLIEQRYPIGWGGAAAVVLEDETELTSVATRGDKRCLQSLYGNRINTGSTDPINNPIPKKKVESRR